MSKKPSVATQTGAQLVVRILEAKGVTHVFGIPGAKIDAVFNALVDSKIKTVVADMNRTPPSSPAASAG
jgi:acetolactate synthase I/II/III large subunit